METRTVRVGDRTISIARFRGLKAIMAGALVARVMRKVPDFDEKIASFQKTYSEKFSVTVTPPMARHPDFAVYDFRPEDFGEEGKVVIPAQPPGTAVIMHLIPDVFEEARAELTRLLGLVLIPNSELEAADDSDQVEEALTTHGRKLLRDADVDEVLEVLVAGWEVLENQIMSKKDSLGKLTQIPFLRTLLSTQPPPETTSETPPTSPEEQQTLSTTSEQDTDGQDEMSSTESPGTSSSSSFASTSA